MAITLTETYNVGEAWGVNGYSADWSGGEELKADPTNTDKKLYLKHIVIHSIAAETWTIRSDTTTVLGPFTTAATAGAPIDYTPKEPIPISGALTAIATGGAAAATIIAEGFTR